MYEKVIEKKDNRKRRNGIDCLNAFLTKFLQLALLSSGFNNHNKKWKIILHFGKNVTGNANHAL